MPNQKDSPEKAASPGSIGPIDQSWEHFVTFNKWQDLEPELLSGLRFAYYCASMDVYNVLVEALRRTLTQKNPAMAAVVTEAYRQNLDQYFKDYSPTKTH